MSAIHREVERAIRKNFPGPNNANLRRRLRAAASVGAAEVRQVGRSVALTVWGQAGLEEVAALVAQHQEMSAHTQEAAALVKGTED